MFRIVAGISIGATSSLELIKMTLHHLFRLMRFLNTSINKKLIFLSQVVQCKKALDPKIEGFQV
jgi:hypothetical protein